MIKYPGGAFGLAILLRLHGSALFRSLIPALLSSSIYIILWHLTDMEDDGEEILDHPYPMGALVAAFTFLLAFRANFAYARYWEAFTTVHQMHSKWIDVGTDLAAFHLQSSRFSSTRPPAFGEHPDLRSLERERERHEPTLEQIEQQIDDTLEQEKGKQKSNMPSRFNLGALTKKRRPKENNNRGDSLAGSINMGSFENRVRHTKKSINAGPVISDTLKQKAKQKAKGHRRKHSVTTTSFRPSDVNMEDDKPLFLQEAAHLLSLLSAVALSTLRNDLENAESPLTTFVPGAPFPSVDPDAETADIREDWLYPRGPCATLRYLLGTSRSEANRALYNAARPFRVIGGVSDAEIEMLQAARGPFAKVTLCSMWLQEFISREHLAGSTGPIAPPIISRLFQYISDGCLGYHQARKIAYIPFPFPHAQITILFVLVIVGFIPVLMLTYITNEAFGFVLNLLTVMCFSGLHEVSRELENPFQNAPNDLPANNFHSQFNEALMTMFSSYHPDAYWEIKETLLPLDALGLSKISSGNLEASSSAVSEQEEAGKNDTSEAGATGEVAAMPASS